MAFSSGEIAAVFFPLSVSSFLPFITAPNLRWQGCHSFIGISLRGFSSPRSFMVCLLVGGTQYTMSAIEPAAIAVFVLLFGATAIIGFVSGRWNTGDLKQLHEWGLGGRRFGTVITWFILGGDVYTAYTS